MGHPLGPLAAAPAVAAASCVIWRRRRNGRGGEGGGGGLNELSPVQAFSFTRFPSRGRPFEWCLDGLPDVLEFGFWVQTMKIILAHRNLNNMKII